jgi:hypothetical protein
MIIAILLIGTFGLTLNLPFAAKADTVYHDLTIDYAPKPMIGLVVPSITPAVGTYPETEGSKINITAPATVFAVTGIQYVFQNWTFWDDTTNASAGSSPSNPFYILMDANYTATAMYKLQYLFTVVTPYDTAWIYDGAAWDGPRSSLFIDAGTVGVRAGLSTGVVSLDYGAGEADFINWTGDATGTYYGASDGLTLTGPMTAIANWTVKYILYTGTHDDYWGPSTGPFGTWVPAGTVVPLTAAENNTANDLHWRWLFDHWDIQNYNGTAWNVVATDYSLTTNVLVDQTKYCIAQYKLQYYLVVTATPSTILCGSESKTGWYYYGDYVTLTANQIVADPTDPVGARWNFSYWWIPSLLYTETSTTTVQILGDYTAYAGYTKQYYIRIKTSPSSIKSMPNVFFTGEGWYNTGAWWTLDALNLTIMINPDTRYNFDHWDFSESGGSSYMSNPASWSANQAWNGTAVYKKYYRATAICNPVGTGYVNLNTWNGWPIAGYEVWHEENTIWAWGAGSGPIAGYPFDYTFDHWTVNGVNQAQYLNAFNLNFSGPKTTVANYAGVSAFFTTPQAILKQVPAYCTTFEINVTAANLVDMYATDFNVTWNPLYLELVSSDVRVGDIWNQSISWEHKLPGNYHLMATQTAPGLGFNGTHTIVRLTFHIIYEPCYVAPYMATCNINLIVNTLADSHAARIWPTNVHGSTYQIDAVKPTLYMKPSTVTVSQKDVNFAVEIWIRNATKLHDWWTTITYDSSLLEVTNAAFDYTFLTGLYSVNYINFATPGQVVFAAEQISTGSPANGTGRLATIYFHVKYSIFWTTLYPTLTCPITFTATGISVMCPDKHYAFPPTDVGIENCVYTYRPIPGDVNKDGVVNALDLMLVAAEYGSFTTYDLNDDHKVDLFDIVLVAINFGKTSP